ncbi:MAG: 50S ribosome-binding GTPase [Candidatus Hydrogenedentes bacterium]|nr:50S ribosome-binding GTPase [Candidatus Hydrogenedentota bacterium]
MGEPATPILPMAFFVGDFNVGKSALINALLRSPLLSMSGEESRSLPTFVVAGAAAPEVLGYSRRDRRSQPMTLDDFAGLRGNNGRAAKWNALAASVPESPFARLALVDTPGMSSDTLETMQIETLSHQEQALLVLVADIEYWFAKHTMDFIAYHQQIFKRSLMIVANKADLMNASELARIQEKAARRMEDYGIVPAPAFHVLSARLELVRRAPHDDARRKTKAKVRDMCDISFDRFRLALYEFERRCPGEDAHLPLTSVLQSPLAASFLAQQDGARV